MRLKIPPPIQGLVAALVIWLTHQALPDYSITFPGQEFLALCVAGVGLVIDLISVAAFFRTRTTVNPLSPEQATELVTTGLYRISRNPMYLGLALILLGWTIWLGTPFGLFIIAAFMASLTYLQIKPEEAALTKIFEDEYLTYRNRVRRWL